MATNQDVCRARRAGERKGRLRALKPIRACVERYPEVSAAVVMEMFERRLTPEEATDELDALAADAE